MWKATLEFLATAARNAKCHRRNASRKLQSPSQPAFRWSVCDDDTTSGNCHPGRGGERIDGGESIFLSAPLLQVHRRRDSPGEGATATGGGRAGVWTPLQLPLSISLPFFFLPRRGVSFRVSEPCYFGERWMGSNCVFRMITMAAATAIAPPRQICGCSDSISRRSDIK